MAGVCRPTAVAFTHTIGHLAAGIAIAPRGNRGPSRPRDTSRRCSGPRARAAPAGTAVIARHPGGLAHYIGRT
jgi:hypothetical protein